MQRLIDAPPEVVFDTYLDPAAQHKIWDDMLPGWSLLECEIDLRVGGTWTIVFGEPGRTPDRVTSVFTVIDRPNRLVVEEATYSGRYDSTVQTTVDLTFEERAGSTLVRIVQAGFETEAARDGMSQGWPSFFGALERVAASRAGRAASPPRSDPTTTAQRQQGGCQHARHSIEGRDIDRLRAHWRRPNRDPGHRCP
jgi:uncharacterized protein YndB with AHSA1/START domain